MPHTQQTHNFYAALWMSGTVLSFTLMAIAGRELSHHLTTFQILFFRSLVGSLLLGFIWLKNKKLQVNALVNVQVNLRHFKAHVIRNFAHFAGQFAWMYGIAYITLAEVFAIEATTPVWTVLIGLFLLEEKLNTRKVFAITLGLIGALVVLKPGAGLIHPAAIVVLVGAIGYGLAYNMTKRLIATETPFAILLMMCIIQMPLSLVPTLITWTTPQGVDWLWLFLVGITALTGHYCITRAMQIAEASVVVPMDFVRVPVIAALGFILYQEPLDWLLLVGAGIILFGNYLNVTGNQSQVRQS